MAGQTQEPELIPINELANGGLNWDVTPAQLPPNVFTDALNVRFRNRAIETILGEALYANVSNLTPKFGIHWPRPSDPGDVFAKDAKIYKRTADGAETVLFNPGAGYADSHWHFDLFGGGYAVIANDGQSTPKYALFGHPVTDSLMDDFPGWNYGGKTITAKIIKPFGYSLVAANLTITDGGTTTLAPVTLHISVPAPIGGFPEIWEPGLSNTAADAFEVQSKSPLTALTELRGSMYIYSSESISVLSVQNGASKVSGYISGYGALNQDCVVEFDSKHFVVDRNSIYIHGGSGVPKSISEERVGDRFFNEVDLAYAEKVFCVKNTSFTEIMVCYPTSGSGGVCTKALIYNYRNDTWTVRTLPGVTCMFVSRGISGGAFINSKETLIACIDDSPVLLLDSSYLMYDGVDFVPFLSYVAREKVFLGNPLATPYIDALAVLLKVTDDNHSVTIRISGGDVYDRSTSWANTDGREAFSIYPRRLPHNHRVDPRASHRFLDYRIEATIPWQLASLGILPTKVIRR